MRNFDAWDRNRIAWAVILITVLAILAYAITHKPTQYGTEPITLTNLPVICTDASKEGQQVSKCPSTSQVFTAAGDISLVRNCPSTNCTNASGDNVLRKFRDVSATSYVEVCTVAKEDPTPVYGGSCATSAGNWAGMRWVLPVAVRQEDKNPSTFTVTPSSGVAPLTISLAWVVPGASQCEASGAWSGIKGSSGTQTIHDLMKNATYNIRCIKITGSSSTGTAKLSWILPTHNIDGSPITNLAGFRIYHGASPTILPTTVQIEDPTATTTTLGALPLGVRYFAMRSYNTVGVESTVLSNVASKDIKGESSYTVVFEDSRQVAVTPGTVPNPPTGLVVE